MPDEPMSTLPVADTPAWRNWLATNKKLAILIGVVLVLAIAAGVVLWRPWATSPQTPTTNQAQTNSESSTPTNSGSGVNRSFGRDQATVNRAAPSAAVNAPRPTKEQTAAAIHALTNSSTNTNK